MALTGTEYQLWRSRLNQAMSLQAQQKTRWESSLDFIRLRWFEKKFGSGDPERVEVHWAWSYLNTLIPTLYARDPHIFVKPRRPRSTPFAETMEEIENYFVQEMHLKDSVQRAISDSVVTGIGWMEVGYHPKPDEIQTYEEAEREKKQDIRQKIQQVVDKILNPKLQQEDIQTPALGQLLPEIREGEVYIRWIPFWRILLAPGYHMVREMPYLIQIEDIEPEDLMANPKYKEELVRQIRPTRQVNVSDRRIASPQPALGSGGYKPIPVVRLYHIWDRRGQQIISMAEGFQEELFHGPWPYGLDEFPFVPLIFNDTPPDETDSYAYPMDDITPQKPQLIEKSMLRTSMVKARRRSAPIIVVDKTIVSNENEIRNLEENEEAIIVPITGGAKGITPIQPVRLPDDIYKVDGVIDNDLATVSGLSQLLLSGQNPPSINTATEAQIIQGGANLRVSRRVNIIEEFIIEVARRVASICWEKCDQATVAEILGKPVNEDMWPDISQIPEGEKKRRIRAELDFRIEAGATQPEQIRLVEQNLWIRGVNMIQAVAPDRIQTDKLLEQLLKKLGFKDIEYIVKSFDDQERQAADQENQLLLQGQTQIVSPNEQHDVHIQSHGMAAQMGATPQLDQHIMSHQQFRMAQNPKSRPQQGDVSSPAQAGVPELQRKGVERFPDLSGTALNLGAGLGPESSMRP